MQKYRVDTAEGTVVLIDTPRRYCNVKRTMAAVSYANLLVIVVKFPQMADELLKDMIITGWAFGVRHFAVCVNVSSEYNEEGLVAKFFTDVKSSMEQLGKKMLGKCENIMVIPLDVLRGDNVVEMGDRWKWYEGPTLHTLISQIKR